MKLAIKDRDEAERVIDQFGGNQQKIKALYEAWANENPGLAFEGKTMEGQTGKFAYAMAARKSPFDKVLDGEKQPQATYIQCPECGARIKIAES
ncbi:MAG: hypothetical protein Q4G65_12130 [bacterium]|nr:hypothetical protein [bacterium]